MALNSETTGAPNLNFSSLEQLGVFRDINGCIKFLREHQLLAKEMNCPKCASPMKEEKTVTSEQDGYRWRCQNDRCKSSSTIRKGSIFEESENGLIDLTRLIYHWVMNSPHERIAFESKVSEDAVMDWANILRNVCLSDYMSNGELIGGPGHIVSVDEMQVPQKCCMDVEGQPLKEHWLFGGIDHTTRKVFVDFLPEHGRTVSVIGELITRHIARGTTIWSKNFAYCRCIKELGQGYIHETINRGHENITERRMHSNNLQRLWMSIKLKFKEMEAVPSNLISSYVGEWCWRRQYPRPGNFMEMLRAIANNPLYDVSGVNQ